MFYFPLVADRSDLLRGCGNRRRVSLGANVIDFVIFSPSLPLSPPPRVARLLHRKVLYLPHLSLFFSGVAVIELANGISVQNSD